jgi:hypothetical protein
MSEAAYGQWFGAAIGVLFLLVLTLNAIAY